MKTITDHVFTPADDTHRRFNCSQCSAHVTYHKHVNDSDMYVDGLPIPMLLWCPQCGKRHHDVGEFATKQHHTHACQHCGNVWRPAIVFTVGVEFLPGFKNNEGS